jgi:hypothetical protein
MVTSFNIRFSHNAAFRIMSQRLSQWGKVACVHRLIQIRKNLFNAVYSIKIGNRIFKWACFLGKKAFDHHFHQRRKEEGKKLLVQEIICYGSQQFEVYNPTKGSSYTTTVENDQIYCECEDYQNQKQFWGKGLCKHGWATLAHLGFSSFKDFLGRGSPESVGF